MNCRQLTKHYVSSLVIVLPIWGLALYGIGYILSKFVFPWESFNAAHLVNLHYEPFIMKSIMPIALAILLLLRRARSNYPDRTFYIEIPLIVFSFLLFLVNGMFFFTFQNYNPKLLYFGILLTFLPTYLLLGLFVALASYWNRKFSGREFASDSNARNFLIRWRIAILLYLLIVVCVSLAYLLCFAAISSHLLSEYSSLIYAPRFFQMGITAAYLQWLHLGSHFWVPALVTEHFFIVAIVTLFLFRRIITVEPSRVFRVEIPIMAFIWFLFRIAGFLLIYSTVVGISDFEAMLIIVIPTLFAWLWMVVVARLLIRMRKRMIHDTH